MNETSTAGTHGTQQLVQVGVCSLCKGPVMLPSFWSGTSVPTPTCSACGAVEIPYCLREIPMMKKGA